LKAPPPDYAQADAWAAMPGKDSLALYVPEGVENADGMRAVDVFFVHPTGYLNGGDWNSPLNANSRTEENTKWMLANQASAYNGCCNVYAPRYREASIFRYLSAPPDIAEKAMDLAYSDVERAFQFFLDHTQGRPFIIASHSQGTTHAFRLIEEHVDGTPLAGRMVAGYLIGSQITNAEADALKTVPVCNSETQTGCIVHWAAWGDGGTPPPEMVGRLVCVNPLTWTRDGGRADASLHKGGVPVSGKFSVIIWGDDSPQGVDFKPLGAPVTASTWAECRDGLLFVADQAGNAFGALSFEAKNYHGLDYPLFHMDVRENARARATAYLQTAVQAATAGEAP
jgi:pimeloyl-ACP methyl ester carboxylesterase